MFSGWLTICDEGCYCRFMGLEDDVLRTIDAIRREQADPVTMLHEREQAARKEVEHLRKLCLEAPALLIKNGVSPRESSFGAPEGWLVQSQIGSSFDPPAVSIWIDTSGQLWDENTLVTFDQLGDALIEQSMDMRIFGARVGWSPSSEVEQEELQLTYQGHFNFRDRDTLRRIIILGIAKLIIEH